MFNVFVLKDLRKTFLKERQYAFLENTENKCHTSSTFNKTGNTTFRMKATQVGHM